MDMLRYSRYLVIMDAILTFLPNMSSFIFDKITNASSPEVSTYFIISLHLSSAFAKFAIKQIWCMFQFFVCFLYSNFSIKSWIHELLVRYTEAWYNETVFSCHTIFKKWLTHSRYWMNWLQSTYDMEQIGKYRLFWKYHAE